MEEIIYEEQTDQTAYARRCAEYTIKHMLSHGRGKKPKDAYFYDGELKMLGSLYYEKDGKTAGELSTKLRVSTARVARMLNALEEKEMIVRKKDVEDKRKILVYLTDKGKEYVVDKFQVCLSFLENMYEKLGENDTKEYLRILEKIEKIILNCDCGK